MEDVQKYEKVIRKAYTLVPHSSKAYDFFAIENVIYKLQHINAYDNNTLCVFPDQGAESHKAIADIIYKTTM
ncbi:hypothetical protein ACI3PL_31860, partial [Lacticaseibacillus paracasei]